MKKLMLGALAALCAMLALPVFASATPLHVTPQPVGAFSIHGGKSALSRVAGGGTHSETVTGSGVFETTTTGRLQLKFHEATSSIGTKCNSPGQTSGTITTTELTFHLVTLHNEKPGILITGGPTETPETEGEGAWGHHFADFSCGIFIPTIQVRGKGILGTITAPECGKTSNTATVSFKPTAPGSGIQEHTTDITGNTYDLESSIGGGAYSTSAMEAHVTITFAGGATPKLECT